VITGYFSSPEQVAVAAEALDRVRAAAPGAQLIVDPIMGDGAKGLYVKEAVAEAIATLLVARADIVAPNAWELGRLTGAGVSDPPSGVAAARRLGKPVVVSSIRAGGEIGVVYAADSDAWFASHPAATAAPNGTGDLLTALFAAASLGQFPPAAALELAVSGVAEAVVLAGGMDELPIAALPVMLVASPRVRLAPLHG
jgi:pyridoxine kinase